MYDEWASFVAFDAEVSMQDAGVQALANFSADARQADHFEEDVFADPLDPSGFSFDFGALLPSKAGGADDWLTPLRDDRVDDIIVNPPSNPPGGGSNPTSPTMHDEWNGHNSDQQQQPIPVDPCVSFLQASNPEGGEYKVPPSFNINELIAAGNTIDSIPVSGIGLKLVQFKTFVGPGGHFDYKIQTSERETYTQADGTIGTRSIYDPIGNWAYGFIAEIAGIEFAAFYAWLNEQIDGDGVGEDPIDQMHITAGYEAARLYKQTGILPQERNIYCH